MMILVLLAALSSDSEIKTSDIDSEVFEMAYIKGPDTIITMRDDEWVITRARRVKLLPCGGPWVCEPDGDGMICECRGPLP